MAKRKIVLGFEELSELEKDNIYVTFEKDHGGSITADVISNANFKFEGEWGKGIRVRGGYYHKKIELLTDSDLINLAGLDDGAVDYSRLIEEGAKKYLYYQTLKDTLKKLAR